MESESDIEANNSNPELLVLREELKAQDAKFRKSRVVAEQKREESQRKQSEIKQVLQSLVHGHNEKVIPEGFGKQHSSAKNLLFNWPEKDWTRLKDEAFAKLEREREEREKGAQHSCHPEKSPLKLDMWQKEKESRRKEMKEKIVEENMELQRLESVHSKLCMEKENTLVAIHNLEEEFRLLLLQHQNLRFEGKGTVHSYECSCHFAELSTFTGLGNLVSEESRRREAMLRESSQAFNDLLQACVKSIVLGVQNQELLAAAVGEECRNLRAEEGWGILQAEWQRRCLLLSEEGQAFGNCIAAFLTLRLTQAAPADPKSPPVRTVLLAELDSASDESDGAFPLSPMRIAIPCHPPCSPPAFADVQELRKFASEGVSQLLKRQQVRIAELHREKEDLRESLLEALQKEKYRYRKAREKGKAWKQRLEAFQKGSAGSELSDSDEYFSCDEFNVARFNPRFPRDNVLLSGDDTDPEFYFKKCGHPRLMV